MYNIEVIKDKVKQEEVNNFTVNSYTNVEHCQFVLPVSETEELNYTVIKECVNKDLLMEYSYV